MALLTFKGGIHPDDGKRLAKDKAPRPARRYNVAWHRDLSVCAGRCLPVDVYKRQEHALSLIGLG